MTNTFARSDRDKDPEILALRHQITVLERQLGDTRPRFSSPTGHSSRHYCTDCRCVRFVDSDYWSGRKPTWGYQRIHGELHVLGITVAASTVWQILKDAGINPAPERTSTTWATLLRSQADALLACDFFETQTLNGTRLYVLAVIEHASRRIRVLDATAHPTASWVTQAARNLAMDLEDEGRHVRFPIRDRDGKFPALFDTVLADAGIQVVLSGVRTPRMNAIMERWIRSCRRELLDRTLIWNRQHLLHALHEYEHFYNTHRPHQGIANTRPPPQPQPATDLESLTRLDIHRRQRLGGILNEYHHAA